MKIFALVAYPLLAMVVWTNAQADIILISSSANVSIGGHTIVPTIYGGESDSYSLVRSGTNFELFSESLSEEAWAEITVLPPFGLCLGTTLHVASRASQSTAITAQGITLSSEVLAGSWPNSQVGSLVANAHSLTEIIFQVDELSTFSLSGNGSHYQSDWPYVLSEYMAALSPVNGTPIFQIGGFRGRPYSFYLTTPITGTLAPGTYSLLAYLNAIAVGDPIGEGGSGNLSLRIASVPETGSSIVSFSWALLIVMLARRRAAGKRGHLH
ncbi:MAG: hypothetical protein K1X42_04320 [Opitutaceae bacterium]|nr:hypothetical protein [Opitutaceae bacterium]